MTTFTALLGERLVFLISSQLDIFCTSALQQYCTNNNYLLFMFHLFSRLLEFVEAKY